MQLQLTPNEFATAGVVTGTVTITGETRGTVSAINVDAQPNLNIDSVRLDGAPSNFRRNNTRVVINFTGPMPAGRPFTIVIQYHGAGSGGSIGGGLLFTRHGPGFLPVMATHSEPFGAPLWWPCIDNPADKATGRNQTEAVARDPGTRERQLHHALDVTIHYSDGASETRAVFNETRKQRFSFTVSKQPVSVVLDESHWILKKVK